MALRAAPWALLLTLCVCASGAGSPDEPGAGGQATAGRSGSAGTSSGAAGSGAGGGSSAGAPAGGQGGGQGGDEAAGTGQAGDGGQGGAAAGSGGACVTEPPDAAPASSDDCSYLGAAVSYECPSSCFPGAPYAYSCKPDKAPAAAGCVGFDFNESARGYCCAEAVCQRLTQFDNLCPSAVRPRWFSCQPDAALPDAACEKTASGVCCP